MDGDVSSTPVRSRRRVVPTCLQDVLGANEDFVGSERNVYYDAADGPYGGLEGLRHMYPENAVHT